MADFEDLFDGTLDTNLTDHTPDVGTGWTGGGSTTDNARLTGNGEIKGETNEGQHTIFSDDLGSADHQIWFRTYTSEATPNARVTCRTGDAANNSYGIGVAYDGTDLNITYRDGGSTNSLTTHTHGLTQPFWIRLKCEGDTVSAWKSQDEPTNPEEDTNWTSIGSWTVTVNNTVTVPGLFIFGNDVQNSSVEIDPWLDTYKASALSGGDTTAPTLTNPTGTETGSSTADGSVDTDEGNGTLYWVTTTSSTAPSVAQIQAGQDDSGSAAADSGNQAVSSTGTQNVSASGLSASTTYYFHFQQQDDAGNDSTVVSSTSFTTQSSDTTAPTLTNPTGTSTGSTTADGTVDTDEGNGTLYWVVDTSSTAPSVAEIQAGQGSDGAAADDSGNQSVSSTGTQNVSSSGLSQGTTYYFHFQHQDDAGNDSGVVSSTSFTTDSVTKGVSVTLYDRDTQSIRASITGIVARWWDNPTDTGAPLFESTTQSTDSNGVIQIDLDSVTSLNVGDNGYLVLYKEQADKESDWHFSARVPIEDIS